MIQSALGADPDSLLPPSGQTVHNPDLLPPSHRPRRKRKQTKHWYNLFIETTPARDALITPSFHGFGEYGPPVRGYPGYAAPGYAAPGYAPRGPGGLPTNQASLDVKAFIPAQYEHVRLTPLTGILVIAGFVGVVSLIQRHKIVTK